MSWFQKKASRDRVSLPFPVERISALEPIVAAAIESACRMRGSPKVQHAHIVMSKAFNSYICGFPKFLDYQDPQLGASVRKMILTMFYDDNQIQIRFDTIQILLENDDKLVSTAFSAGAADGEIYWQDLIRSQPVSNHAFRMLGLLIRTSDLKPLIID